MGLTSPQFKTLSNDLSQRNVLLLCNLSKTIEKLVICHNCGASHGIIIHRKTITCTDHITAHGVVE